MNPSHGDAPELVLVDEADVYVEIGEVVAGKYRVEEVIGVGGMAFVLAATHVELEQRFALKFLAKGLLGDAAIIERFTREARAACRLRSAHIAHVHDVGVHAGAPFLVMEHLVGRDLAGVVTTRGPLPIDEAVEYAMQACEALAVAHRHGIVHRDIKPENLFLVEEDGLPSVKLLDFGISKVGLPADARASLVDRMERAERLTGDLTLGTPCYMAPEQIRSSAAADARSDQWSLGVVLYELLTGTEAFRAPTVTEVCAAVLEREPPPIEGVRPSVPPELVAVVRRCLAKSPADRFEDVAALADALLPFGPSRALVSAERSSSLMRAATGRHPRASAPRAETPCGSPPVPAAMEGPRPARGARWRRTVIVAAASLGALAAFAIAQPRERVAVVRADPPPPAAPSTKDSPPAAVAIEASARPAPLPFRTSEPVAAARPSRRAVPTTSPRPKAPAVPTAESASPKGPTSPGAAVELGY